MNKNSTAFGVPGIEPHWTSRAKDRGMLPELIWDGDDLPDRAMKRGNPAGSAMPLCWSHAAYIQPEEGITLLMRAKMLGPTIRTQAVALDFDHSQFDAVAPIKGSAKMLYDCIVGDSTLFHRTDLVEAAWRLADPIVNASENSRRKAFPTTRREPGVHRKWISSSNPTPIAGGPDKIQPNAKHAALLP